MIHVCSLSRLEDTVVKAGAGRLVTLLREGTPFVRPASIAAENHLALFMHDILQEEEGMVAPAHGHVRALVDFATRWDRARPLVIHCYAGVSRSTAAAYVVAAALSPQRDEEELARALRRLSPSATPR